MASQFAPVRPSFGDLESNLASPEHTLSLPSMKGRRPLTAEATAAGSAARSDDEEFQAMQHEDPAKAARRMRYYLQMGEKHAEREQQRGAGRVGDGLHLADDDRVIARAQGREVPAVQPRQAAGQMRRAIRSVRPVQPVEIARLHRKAVREFQLVSL